jgi:hypothetical protein
MADVPSHHEQYCTKEISRRTTMTRIFNITILFAALTLLAALSSRAYADPLTGEVLKFQQLPLNNGIYPPTGAPTGGQPYAGHDEWSTAILNNPGNNDYRGTFAADDFSDNYSTPVVHVRWWGSYESNNNLLFPNANVKKFLISFESDTIGGPANQPFSQPGTPLLTQEVNLGALTPGSGTFTEALVNGNVPEHLYQYNAELALPFNEQANTIYWLKIVALEDPSIQNPVKWGWHNRDWGVKDNLASPVPSPGEHDEGPLVLSNGPNPVWHFQDDAVNGQIDYGLNTAGVFQINSESNMAPLNYTFNPGVVPFVDGPPGIQNYSEDLSFELYTTVPEPNTIVLMLLGSGGMAMAARSRKRT